MTNSTSAPIHEHIREEAISWLIAFSEGEMTRSARARFECWLKQSPEHVRAYLQVSALWEAAGALRHTESDELVRYALAESNIVLISEQLGPLAPRFSRRVALLTAAWAASVVLSLTAGIVVWRWASIPTYEARIGERRTINLSDGSTVELNAHSRILVRYSAAERDVDLTEGQALFHVSKNSARPFIVQSGLARVRAVGTEFDVDRKASRTVVTVVEGKVAVFGIDSKKELDPAFRSQPVDPPHSVFLAAGDQLNISTKVMPTPVHANVNDVTAWRSGKLVFDSTPLADVIETFNRFHAKPLVIDDPVLLSYHVSGTFSTSDSDQVVRFLAERFGLHVRESEDAIRLSRS